MFTEESFKRILSGKATGIVPTVLRFIFWLLSFPYRWIVQFRNWRFDGRGDLHRAAVPVISVGNLTTGGTGKTPLVCALCRFLVEKRRRPVILSRGYKSKGTQNDEAMELDIRIPDVPHLQNPDRRLIADQAVQDHEAGVLVMDDGFQHRKLHRDLDIVVVDATNPFGFNYLLPRGLLREPIKNISRADIAVISRSNLVSPERIEQIKTQLRRSAPTLPVYTSVTRIGGLLDSEGRQFSISEVAGKKAIAFCGIGNPRGFQMTLEELEIDLQGFEIFGDHYSYGPDDLNRIEKLADECDCDVLICTHKDLVKIARPMIGTMPLRAVKIDFELGGNAQEFWEQVEHIF